VIRTFYITGGHHLSDITRWSDDFSNVMRNQFRLQLVVRYNETGLLKCVEVLAWQITTCVSRHWERLLIHRSYLDHCTLVSTDDSHELVPSTKQTVVEGKHSASDILQSQDQVSKAFTSL
jgi:hypothetical protein